MPEQEDLHLYSVQELTQDVRLLLEDTFDDVWVEGELSNVKIHSSGHVYFTLKDPSAQLSGVMWRGYTQYLFFEPRDGMLVRAHGHLSVYERRGAYQLIARSLRPAGEGALRQAFEKLKAELEAEGLFAAEHKQPLPPYPECIGVITSGDGAALRDILSVLSRRFPQVEVLICPVRVQGPGAAEEIAAAIDAFNDASGTDLPQVDLLIIGRGGGSVEDLWAFNEVMVARSVFASRLPIISAVGHEVDVTIADYVADVRASTPSMAAELAVPDRQEVASLVLGAYARIREQVQARIDAHRSRITLLTSSHAFNRPVDRMHQTIGRVEELERRLKRSIRQSIAHRNTLIQSLQHRLDALHPDRPLKRGYAYVEQDGVPVSSATMLHEGDFVLLRFQDGRASARVVETD